MLRCIQIINSYVDGRYDSIGFEQNYHKNKEEIIWNQIIKFEIWEIYAKNLNIYINEFFIRKADIIILVYKAANKLSFDAIKYYWYNFIQNNMKEKVNKK